MITLSQQEAVAVLLYYAKNHCLRSKTAVNKALSNLIWKHVVPVDTALTLNRYGSFDEDVVVSNSPYYHLQDYVWSEGPGTSSTLTAEGAQFAETVIRTKLGTWLSPDELRTLSEDIQELSDLPANYLSNREHKILFVDVKDRHKLVQRINSVNIDLLDLNGDRRVLNKEVPIELRLSALIEFCYSLSSYLRNHRFGRLQENEYDFKADMRDYYFLYILENKAIPFIQQQLKSLTKNDTEIRRLYHFFVNSVRKNYPFSIDNPKLLDLIH